MSMQPKKNLPAITTVADTFLEAAAELGLRTPRYLKFTKGQWTTGGDSTPINDGLFAVDVAAAERGYVCFREDGVPAIQMLPIKSGRKVLPEELPDLGNFPDGNGWKEAASLRLVQLCTAEEYTYCATSEGGRDAIAKLLRQHALRLKAGRAAVPIIELRASSYKHRLYGMVDIPDLYVVEWREGSAAAKADEDLRDDLDDDCPF